jgi:hypothetical protein
MPPLISKLRDMGKHLLAFEWMTLVNACKLGRFAVKVLNEGTLNY